MTNNLKKKSTDQNTSPQLNNECITCGKLKAKLECGLCHVYICKNCAHFLEPDSFSFFAKTPDELLHSVYCGNCYTEKVLPELDSYQTLMERAKEIAVFDKKQGKETSYIKRVENPISVIDCKDYNETLLRLAFFAAQKNFNAIIDVDIKSKKIKDGSYQTTRWSGSAVPAHVDEKKLLKDRANWHNPN